jgi:chemosensory pili system protein ChpA (sensor histidine kinase/response regulator)
MVTSRGGEKHRERAIKLGVNDYLTKPYQEEQLMQSIRKILGERALGVDHLKD